MPMPRRALLTVLIDLDPVPGTMHTGDSAKDAVQSALHNQLGHYNPVVVLEDVK